MISKDTKQTEDIQLSHDMIILDIRNCIGDNVDEIWKYLEESHKGKKIEKSQLKFLTPKKFCEEILYIYSNSKKEETHKIFDQIKLKFDLLEIYQKLKQTETSEVMEIRELLCNHLYLLKREIGQLLDLKKGNPKKFENYQACFIKTVTYTFNLIKLCLKIKGIKLEKSLNFARVITHLTFKLYKEGFNSKLNDIGIMTILKKMCKVNENTQHTVKESLTDFIETGAVYRLNEEKGSPGVVSNLFIDLILDICCSADLSGFRHFVINNLKEEYYMFHEKNAKKFVKILLLFLKGNFSLRKKLIITEFILKAVNLGFPDSLVKPYNKLHFGTVLDILASYISSLPKIKRASMNLYQGMDEETGKPCDVCKFCGTSHHQIEEHKKMIDIRLYDDSSKTCMVCRFYASAVPRGDNGDSYFEGIGILKKNKESYKSCCKLVKEISANVRTIVKLLIAFSNRESKDRLRSSIWQNLANLIIQFKPLGLNDKINSCLAYKLNDKYYKIRENSMKILSCFDASGLTDGQVKAINMGVESFLTNFYDSRLSEKIKLSHIKEFTSFVSNMKETYMTIETSKNKESLFGIYSSIFVNLSEKLKEEFRTLLTVLLYPHGRDRPEAGHQSRLRRDYFFKIFFEIFDLSRMNQFILNIHEKTINSILKKLAKRRGFDVSEYLIHLLKLENNSILRYFLIPIMINNLPKDPSSNTPLQSSLKAYLESKKPEILMENHLEDRNSYSIKYLFDTMKSIVTTHPVDSEVFKLTRVFTDEVLKQFWDYPRSTYSSTCGFIFAISCALDDPYKLDALLVKSMSFIEITTKEVISQFDTDLTIETALIEPIESVVKTITEIWRLLDQGFKNRSYAEKLSRNFFELLKIDDQDLRVTLYLAIYELNFDFEDSKILELVVKNVDDRAYVRETMTVSVQILKEERGLLEKKPLRRKITMAYRQKSDFLIKILDGGEDKKTLVTAMELVMILAMERELNLRVVFCKFFKNVVNEDPEISKKAVYNLGELYRFEPRLTNESLQRGILVGMLENYVASSLTSEALLDILWDFEKTLNLPRDTSVSSYARTGLFKWNDFPFNRHSSSKVRKNYNLTRNYDFILLMILAPNSEIRFRDVIEVTIRLMWHISRAQGQKKQNIRTKILGQICGIKLENITSMLIDLIAGNFQTLFHNRSKGSKMITRGFYSDILDSPVHDALEILLDKFKTSKETVKVNYVRIREVCGVIDQINEISLNNFFDDSAISSDFINMYEEFHTSDDLTYLDFADVVKRVNKDTGDGTVKRDSGHFGGSVAAGGNGVRRGKRVRKGRV